jgi:hypothetical protein
MPRKSRIDTPGALHHIIARGIERRSIFGDDHDRDNFLKRLGMVLSETGTKCYAWASKELGMSQVFLAQKFKVSQPAISAAIRRGEKIIIERKLQLEQ